MKPQLLVPIGIFGILSGCGTSALSPSYRSSGKVLLSARGTPMVTVRVHDARPEPVFFRDADGVCDDEGRRGPLRLARSPEEIFRDGFTETLQHAGCVVRNDAEVVLDVGIKRFLAVDSPPSGLRGDVVLKVAVKRGHDTFHEKTIFADDAEPSARDGAHISELLSRTLGRAIEQAVGAPDLIAAIERATGGSVRQPAAEPSGQAPPAADRVGLVRPGVPPRVRTSFVLGVRRNLPHEFPRDTTTGLWVSSLPVGIDVFVFPKGFADQFKVVSTWAQGKDASPYYLGKGPLHADLVPGQYEVVFVHPPVPDSKVVWQTSSVTTPDGRSMVLPTGAPTLPFAAYHGGVFAINNVLYPYQDRNVRIGERGLESVMVAWGVKDKPFSALLAGLPEGAHFRFDESRLGDVEHYCPPKLALGDAERAEALRLLRRAGLWVKRANAGYEVIVEVQPDGSLSFTWIAARGAAAPMYYPPPAHTVTQTLLLLKHPGPVNTVAFSPDGRRVASSDACGAIRLWDSATGKEIGRFSANESGVTGLAFYADGRHLLTAHGDGAVRKWDLANGKELPPALGQGEPIYALAMHPSGSYVACGRLHSPYVELWNVKTGKLIRKRFLRRESVEPVAVNRTMMMPGQDEDKDYGVSCLAFSADGFALAAAVERTPGGRKVGKPEVGGAWLMEFDHGSDEFRSRRERVLWVSEPVVSICFLPGGDGLVYGGMWRITRWHTGEESGGGSQPSDLFPSGHRKFTRGGEHVAFRVWDLACCPGGRRVLSAGDDGSVRLWDLGTKKELVRFTGHDGAARCLSPSPDGRWVASGGQDGTVRLWKLPEGLDLQPEAEREGR